MNIDCNLKLFLLFKKNSKQRMQLLGVIIINNYASICHKAGKISIDFRFLIGDFRLAGKL
jgi:hypothetical protein